MKYRALITGGTGFIGSNLVRALVKQGWTVHLIVRPSSDVDLIEDLKSHVELYEFSGKFDEMLDIVSSSEPNVVFHLASMIVVDHQPTQIKELINSNVTYGSQLLEAMSVNGISHFINTGTYWEHYNKKQYSPVNLYAATKFAFQNLLQYYVEAKNISAITLKLFDTYGPNDPRPKLLNSLLKISDSSESLAMSPGDQKIDLVHIDDVVGAYIVAARRLLNNKILMHEKYGIGSGEPIKLKQLVAMLERKLEKKFNIMWGERPYRTREIMEPYSDYNHLPGWSPKIKLESGLDSVFQFSHQ